jgi:hypothetical protein
LAPHWTEGLAGMKQLICIVLLGSLALPAAADWNSSLSGGRGDVTIHEDNRATIRQGGVDRPLWDGTHRLEDGSTLIIRRGIAVPNPAILEARRQLPQPRAEDWEGRRIVGTSPCERLERKVCGPENECLDTEVCPAVSQLVDREWEERRASHNRGYMTPTSGQCMQALDDTEFFVKCLTETSPD